MAHENTEREHEPRPTLFEPGDSPVDGAQRWISTDYARGPWDARHCHGGPPAALLTRACEASRDDGSDPTVEWQIARITVELMRGVPVGQPLDLVTTVERPGRKVSLVAASLFDGDREVARARSLKIRRDDFDLPDHPTAPPELDGEPGAGTYERLSWALGDDDQIAFHSHSAEHRIVDGSWNDPGPVKLWIRLVTDVVPGETPSGVQRAVAVADFGSGVSSALDTDDFVYINPDLTVHLARPPQGEWIGMSSHSLYGTPSRSTGAGLAESALHDELGRVGRSTQSLLVQPT